MTTARRPTCLVVFVVGLVLGIGAQLVHVDSRSRTQIALELAVGWSYLGAGLAVWWRRPDQILGPLMGAASVAWFLSDYGEGHPLLVSLGMATSAAAVPLITHAVFAYPSGRLRPGGERMLIGAGYAFWLLSAIVIVSFVERPTGCPDCPAGAAAISVEFVEASGAHVEAIGYLVFSLAALGLLARRFVMETPVRRRTLGELWVAGGLATGHVAVTAGRDALGLGPSTVVYHGMMVAKILVPVSLLLGIVRLQLARAAVGGLVVEIGGSAEGASMRDSLGRALGDPALDILYWIPERDAFVDEGGRVVDRPVEGPGTAVTVVERDGRRLAALVHDRALADRPELVEAATAAAALALENARLRAELQVKLDEVQASRARIVEAADAERARIERNLHDGAQQRLLSLAFALRGAQRLLGAGEVEPARDAVYGAVEELGRALGEVRELARGIHPAILTEEGLSAALESLAEGAAVPTTVATDLDGRLPVSIEAAAYYVAAESVANAIKHANASHIEVRASQRDGLLSVEVVDDGVGAARLDGGSGIRGLQDRVAAVGGRLELTSAPGRGTRVVVDLPCA